MGNIIGSDIEANSQRVKNVLSFASLLSNNNSNTYNTNSNNSGNNESNSGNNESNRGNVETPYNSSKKPSEVSTTENIRGGYRKKKLSIKKRLSYKRKRLNKKKRK